MINSSFVKIISSASLQELEQFYLFSKAEYFNNNAFIIKLTNYFLEIHKQIDEKTCDRKLVFKKIFDSEKFDYQKLRHLFSYSLKLYENFVAIENFKNQESEILLKQLKYYYDKDFDNRFYKIEKKLQLFFDNDLKENYKLKYNFHSLKNLNNIKEFDYKNEDELQICADYIDKFYLLEKLKDACEMQNRSLFLNQEYNYGFLNEAIIYYENNFDAFKNDIAILIYYLIYISLTQADDLENYELLHLTIEKHLTKFSKNEARDIYFYLLNFATRKINNGKIEYNKDVFEIYKKLIENKFIIENEVLEEIHYKNIITIGLRTKQHDYVENFIKEYKNYLPKAVRANAYNFNLANFYYEIKRYSKAQELLFNVEYSDIIYNLGAKCLLLRIYFDTNEEDALKAHINAFKIFLTRNKLIANSKYRRYYMFLKLAHATFQIKSDFDYQSNDKIKERLDKLKAKLAVETSVANLVWLQEKVIEIERLFNAIS